MTRLEPESRERATLGGGCFWCLEAVYDQMKGVESVESGYMGGANPDPSYEEVCKGAAAMRKSSSWRLIQPSCPFAKSLKCFL